MPAFRKRLTAALTFVVALSTIVITGAAPALADPVPYTNTPKASWGVNGTIWAVEIVGNTAYVGGEFTQATDGSNTLPRVNLAAFDLNTGDVTSFRADATGTNAVVRSLESDGSDLWVGGRFTSIDGVAKTNLAEIDLGTGNVDGPFAPNPNNIVNVIRRSGSNLYIGGLFTTVESGSVFRSQVAKINQTTGAAILAFKASQAGGGSGMNKNVWDLNLQGSTLYAVGSFTAFFNQAEVPTARDGIAALNATTGYLENVNFGNLEAEDADAVQFENGTLYVGTRGQQALADDNKLIAFNAANGTRKWQNTMDGDIQAIELVGGAVIYGSHDGKETNNDKILAADSGTGDLEEWRPYILPTAADVDGIRAIESSPSHLVIAGDFNVVNGVNLNSLAIFNSLGGDNTPPSTPTNLKVDNVTSNAVTLSWNASTDNVAVAQYQIFRNGARVGTVSGTSFTDTGLAASTTYNYQVKAIDTSSNVSGAASVQATTTSGGGSGTFVDDDGSIFEADIEWLAAVGVTKGCNPPTNDRFCPDDNVTRGQMAAFLVRFLGLTDNGGGNSFVDDDGSIFEADIAKLAAAGITKGCNPPTNDRFCPDDRVTRGQMAAFLVRALGLTDDGGGNSFVDDNGSVFEADIAKLAAAGITKGCNPPTNDRFCPDDAVSRGQMAAFLHRADSFR